LAVVDELGHVPDYAEVHTKIKQQQASRFIGGELSYPLGSLEVLSSRIGDRYLFGIVNKTGKDAGQRIYFSIHELQHLIVCLVGLIKRGILQLTRTRYDN
jgi:hypothetical protein